MKETLLSFHRKMTVSQDLQTYVIVDNNVSKSELTWRGWLQGCISCGILLSGTGARGVSSEHMENVEMFSCSPT